MAIKETIGGLWNLFRGYSQSPNNPHGVTLEQLNTLSREEILKMVSQRKTALEGKMFFDLDFTDLTFLGTSYEDIDNTFREYKVAFNKLKGTMNGVPVPERLNLSVKIGSSNGVTPNPGTYYLVFRELYFSNWGGGKFDYDFALLSEGQLNSSTGFVIGKLINYFGVWAQSETRKFAGHRAHSVSQTFVEYGIPVSNETGGSKWVQ